MHRKKAQNMSKIEPQTFNATESAQYLGIGLTQFYELLNEGCITPLFFSKKSRPRFRIADLDKFILSCRKIEKARTPEIHMRKYIVTKDPKLKKMLNEIDKFR